MIKQHLLEARMKERKVWYPELCEILNMTYQSLHKRIRGTVDFKLREVNAIRKYLGLSCEQSDEIFAYDVELIID